MKERPILFSGPMVRALLEGTKTQTRRVVTPQPPFVAADEAYATAAYRDRCPYGKLGDRLWVRETWTGTWHPTRRRETKMHLAYAADGSERFTKAPKDYVPPKAAAKFGNWVSPLFLPRWASRITLEITKVRVQRLQEISDDDCRAEGFVCLDGRVRNLFAHHWTNINGLVAKRPYGWNTNPWVWAITFREVKP